jgi:hypothetical protein
MKPLFIRRTIRKPGGLARISFRPNGRQGWLAAALAVAAIVAGALAVASNPDFAMDTAVAVFAAVMTGGLAMFFLVAFLFSADAGAKAESAE